MSQTEKADGKRRVEIYDTTLRDGTQGIGVSLSLADKLKITQMLDSLGVDFIEGGYPLSNPKDVAYFEQVRALDLKHARVCAFGMTRRKGITAADDPGMQALVAAGTPVITIVGKTWDLHVEQVLQVSHEENLAMICDSVAFCHTQGAEVFYDAEHFFDGYRANPDYALKTLAAACEGGATRLVLCDTNGGSLPDWIAQAVGAVREQLGEQVGLGIHPHNDSGVAVINALEAVKAGCIQVQGTINGIGERCGNVDLLSVIANLRLKLGYDCLCEDALHRLTEASRYVYELANMNLVANQPFVGPGAFAHKGGMHVHAVNRVAHSYEHIKPESVGNQRQILVSELSGASNIAATLGGKFDISHDRAIQRRVLERVQDLENEGYQFEAALASFELLMYELLGRRHTYFTLDHYRCVILKRNGDPCATEATVKLDMGDTVRHEVAEGDGPVAALDAALRKAMGDAYPAINAVHLADYKVRVVNPSAGTDAKVRVIIDFVVHPVDDMGKVRHFTTIGVNENIVDASWQAITDAFCYHLLESNVPPRTQSPGEAVS